MELEKQVCSLELAKKLQKLGASEKSYFVWVEGTEIKHSWVNERIESELVHQKVGFNLYPAFTVAELGNFLPARIKSEEGIIFCLECWKNNLSWQVSYWWEEDTRHLGDLKIETFNDENEVDARAKMLIYLLEKGYINNEQ